MVPQNTEISVTGINSKFVQWAVRDQLTGITSGDDGNPLVSAAFVPSSWHSAVISRDITAFTKYSVGANQVLGVRNTGWTAATGTASKATFDTATVTTEQLAQRVKALMDAFITHGSIGA